MKKRPKGKKPSLKRRSTLMMIICIVLGFGIVIGRIAQIQFGMGEEIKRRAVSQQFSSVELSARRGTIYDRNGKILAQSASVWKIAVNPAAFENDEQRTYTANGLAEILDLEEENVLEKINNKKSQYEVLRSKVESDLRAEVLDFIENAPKNNDGVSLVPSGGVNFYDDYKRYYPYGSLASSVIGVTGADSQGLSGLEYYYDELLKGTPGKLVTAQNAMGGRLPFEYKQNIEAENGRGLVLTIDETIQSICEKYMKIANEENGVFNRSGCIVMNVKTGEILANATIGGYDLNDPFTLTEEFQKKLEEAENDKDEDETEDVTENETVDETDGDTDESDDETDESDDEAEAADNAALKNSLMYEMWRNKTISDTYYPGSVFKMVTAAMALEEGLIPSDMLFTCTGSYTLYDVEINCHQRSGHGVQTFEQAIMNSCNPALIQIGQLIGEEKFWEYYQAFGFSERTAVDMPGEAEDVFFNADGSMGPVDLAVASFGQNFSITPIQMITAAAAVANGGYLVQPHFVKEILDDDGKVVETVGTEIKRQVISNEVSERLCSILEENAVTGGAKNAYIAGYRIAGKTGTSEKLTDSDDDGIEDYIASFCGFAPAEDAEVIMLIYFDTPLGGAYYGSQVAAPVFADIMSEVLPYLEIQRQYTEDELDNIELKIENYIGLSTDEAIAKAEQSGLYVKIKGYGTTVIGQVPDVGLSIPSGGTVVLFTDEDSLDDTVVVPLLTGISLSTANSIAAEYGVNISLKGSYNDPESIAVSQSIEEGTRVSPGTVITITFASKSFED